MSALDSRILRVTFEVNGQERTYDQEMTLDVNITKSAGTIQNEATVNITGLAKTVRDQLLSETSPYNANYTPKAILIEGGRASTGAFQLYSGTIIQTDVSQPPDVVTSIKSKTLNFNKTVLTSMAYGAADKLSTISAGVATALGLVMTFQATDRNISNFSFTGASAKLIERLSDLGGLNVYVDDTKLIVKDAAVPLKNVVHVLSEQSGMIGAPELTDLGVRVKYFLDPSTQLGGKLTINSTLNASLSGDYVIYNLWHVCASRDTAFYTIAECIRPGRLDNMTGLPVLLQSS